MSTYQQAREALGLRLRELRREARLTGRQLARANGWHPTKVSKVENGRQTPAEADVAAWARACDRPELVDDLVATLRTLESHYVEYRRMFRSGMTATQRAWAELEATASTVRNVETAVVPGLLQTTEYARHRLREGLAHSPTDDVDEAVAARMQRQQVLYQTGKRFHFVLTEAVLRTLLCPPEVMAGQLDRLLALANLPTLRFGVLAFDETLPVAPLHGFWIFDERAVLVENLTAELNLTQPSEVERYLRVFEQLADTARYGAEARTIITRALDELTSTTG